MDALIDGMKVPTSLLDNLCETDLNKSNNLDLEFALEKDGYIFLRNIIDEKKIKQAREDIFKRLNEISKIAELLNKKNNEKINFSNLLVEITKRALKENKFESNLFFP